MLEDLKKKTRLELVLFQIPKYFLGLLGPLELGMANFYPIKELSTYYYYMVHGSDNIAHQF